MPAATDAADKLLAEMARKYGVPVRESEPTKSPPLPVQTMPAPAPLPNPGEKSPTLRDKISERGQELKRVTQYKCGGVIKRMASGGVVRKDGATRKPGDLLRFAGGGGPREDKIPVEVAGKRIKVSDGEGALILPAKTLRNQDAMAVIMAVIQESNDGITPKMGRAKEYADGGLRVGEEAEKAVSPPETADVGPVENTRMRTGLIDGGSQAVPLSQQGALLRGDTSTPNQGGSLGSFLSALPEGGLLKTEEGRKKMQDVIAGKGLRPDIGILGPRSTETPVASTSPGSAGSPPPVENTEARSFLTAARAPTAPPETPTTGIVRTGNSFSGNFPAQQDAGQLLRAGNVDAYGNNTAITKQLQQALDKLKADRENPSSTGFVGMLGSSRQQQADADRFTRFSNEASTASLLRDLANGGGSARQNAAKIATANAMVQRDAANRGQETALAGQEAVSETAKGQQAVLSRGQQLQHNAAMAQVLGSPLLQQGQLLDQAIKAGTLDQAQATRDIQSQLLAAGKAGDTKKQAQLALLLRQLLGKDAEQPYRALQLGGGTDELGNKLPSNFAVIDQRTGQSVMPSGRVGGAVKPEATPSLDEFRAHVVQKNPGVKLTEEQITNAYKQQFGGP